MLRRVSEKRIQLNRAYLHQKAFDFNFPPFYAISFIKYYTHTLLFLLAAQQFALTISARETGHALAVFQQQKDKIITATTISISKNFIFMRRHTLGFKFFFFLL